MNRSSHPLDAPKFSRWILNILPLLVLVTMLTLISIFILAEVGEGRILIVDDDAEPGGNGTIDRPFKRIQDAIDNASEDDTVRVYDGTYYEHLLVNGSVHLIGNGSGSTFINGLGSGDIMKITDDLANVTGFSIGNGTKGVVVESGQVTLTNNSIHNNSIGIIFGSLSDQNVVNWNRIENNSEYGIQVTSQDFVVKAKENWWGHTSGPYHSKNNPQGFGDNITERVEFDPWIGKNQESKVNFQILNRLGNSEVMTNELGAVVYYGDDLELIPEVYDPDGDEIISYLWTFTPSPPSPEAIITNANARIVEFTAGVHHLFLERSDGDPVMPEYNSVPVDYTINLTVTDETLDIVTMLMNVTVLPLARAEFSKQVVMEDLSLTTTVDVIWRGNQNDVAPDEGNISEEHPMFLFIEPTTSPDLNLANRGGIGLVYEISTVGCYLQNGMPGIIEGSFTLPTLANELVNYGDGFDVEGNLKIAHYWEKEKRYMMANDNQVVSEGGVNYVTGRVDQLGIITTLVGGVYFYPQTLLPDLFVERIEFTRQPAIDGQEVGVRAYISNKGTSYARNVKVNFYDGSDLIGESMIKLMVPGEESILIEEWYTVTMWDYDQNFEDHSIIVYVDKQRAVREDPQNYGNNVARKNMTITTNLGSTCWHVQDSSDKDVSLTVYALILFISGLVSLGMYAVIDPWERFGNP